MATLRRVAILFGNELRFLRRDPRLLVALRQDHGLDRAGWRAWLFGVWAFVMRRPRLYEMAGLMIRSFWPAAPEAWKVPRPAAKSFRQLWRERGK